MSVGTATTTLEALEERVAQLEADSEQLRSILRLLADRDLLPIRAPQTADE